MASATVVPQFAKWAKTNQKKDIVKIEKGCVIYTRVSSKEQANTNLSLEYQLRITTEHAGKNNMPVLASFGGTFESAKTDGRREFNRMLEFIKANRRRVTHIYVMLLDRFSRTGGEAIKLAEDIRKKYGVEIYAVLQPIDTSNTGGILQQNIQLLFSKHDNDLRRECTMRGTMTKSESGLYCHKPPLGYQSVYTDGRREIVMTETAKLLKKAFEWKAAGLPNETIIGKLEVLGLKMYKQKLSMIFSNPFYAGVVVHKSLKGRAVEGKHPPLISRELFMKVNNVRKEAGGKYGIAHTNDSENIPLKMFMACAKCGNPFTGYKAKHRENLYYYKCRTKGCGCNKNAVRANELFAAKLSELTIKPEMVAPLMYQLNVDFERLNQDRKVQRGELEKRLAEVDKKIETLQEKYLITDNVSPDVYNKFLEKYTAERDAVTIEMQQSAINGSNIEKYMQQALGLASKLPSVWASSDAAGKMALQKLVFPEGIAFDTKSDTVLTKKVNAVFQWIADRAGNPSENENGQTATQSNLSIQVGMARFELATSWSQTRRDNRATLHPELFLNLPSGDDGEIRTCDLLVPNQAR
jgi:site-specific DNA recombinase